MAKVIGVKFINSPKIYYFDAGNYSYTEGCGVIVETVRGQEYGTVALLPHEVPDDKVVQPLKAIIRIATEKDEQILKEIRAKKASSYEIVQRKLDESGLDMKLVDIEYTFDGTKLIIYFMADGRVDFRNLVKELAAVFHIRIELRQIGARDECKMLGGLGPCGRACCCSDSSMRFAHVTIKMAKNQNLSLNPSKISGLCGRLMCCLDYENAHYVETNKKMPKLNSEVTLTDGRKGKVTELNQLKESVRVKIQDTEKDTFEIVTVPLEQIKSFSGTVNEDISDDINDKELENLED